MKNKKIKINLIIFILTVLLISIISTASFAASFSLSEVINQAIAFPGNTTEISTSDMISTQKTIYDIVWIAGIIVSVVGITILGIQFITSAPEGKADVKQRMIPFVVGCIVIFAGITLWRFAVNVIQSTNI